MLKNAGFSVKLTEGDHIFVKVSEFERLPIMKQKKTDSSVNSIKAAAVRPFRRGIARCVEKNQKGICEDLTYLPMSWFEPEISCYTEKDGEMTGFLLFHKHPSGMLTVILKHTGTPKGIELTFIDDGAPYDPLAQKAPDTNLSGRERKAGGLGIFLVKKLMDEMNYEFLDEKNVLVIRKNYG